MRRQRQPSIVEGIPFHEQNQAFLESADHNNKQELNFERTIKPLPRTSTVDPHLPNPSPNNRSSSKIIKSINCLNSSSISHHFVLLILSFINEEIQNSSYRASTSTTLKIIIIQNITLELRLMDLRCRLYWLRTIHRKFQIVQVRGKMECWKCRVLVW